MMENKDEDIFDVAALRSEFENSIISEMQIASFAERTITEKDRKILKLRMEGYTEQEIADAYEDFVPAEYGKFLDKRCK